jgi:hypothetical protein
MGREVTLERVLTMRPAVNLTERLVVSSGELGQLGVVACHKKERRV